MVDHLTNALRDMRLSAAHYKLQHNMAVMESQEMASRMAVELAMAHRELDVLQQADANRRHAAAPAQSYADTANAANAIIMADMARQNLLLRAENEQLRDWFDHQKRLTDHREGELASLIDENDRLKSRIRKNRDHMAPFLDRINDPATPRSAFVTPRRLHRAPNDFDAPNLDAPNFDAPNFDASNFDALLLADKMLSQESAAAPTSRGHHRGAQSMSSLPNTPNRRSHPYPRPPRTSPTPPAHYQQKPAHDRRQSSISTITASSIDDEEAFTDREDNHDQASPHDQARHIPESQASHMASTMLRPAPPKPSSHLVQTKLFGHVKKAHSSRPAEMQKRRPEHTRPEHTRPEYRRPEYSRPEHGRPEHSLGLGMGGLRE